MQCSGLFLFVMFLCTSLLSTVPTSPSERVLEFYFKCDHSARILSLITAKQCSPALVIVDEKYEKFSSLALDSANNQSMPTIDVIFERY